MSFIQSVSNDVHDHDSQNDAKNGNRVTIFCAVEYCTEFLASRQILKMNREDDGCRKLPNWLLHWSCFMESIHVHSIKFM